jgi:protein O-GlcNAc transferase
MTADTASGLADAHAKYQAGDLADAADLFQKVLERDPRQSDALHMLGVIAYQFGQTDAAEALLRQALHERQPFAEAETNLGTVLMALGRLEEAAQVLAKAHDHAPDNPVIAFNLGNAYADQRKWPDAEAMYDRAVALDPRHAEAWCQLGIVRRARENLDGACAAYEKAIAARPTFHQAMYNLANVHRNLGRLREAEKGLRNAIAAKPDYAMAWNSLGTLLGDMARSDDALAAFDNAVKFAPESAAYASNRLSALQYIDGIDTAKLAEAHSEWYWLHVAPSVEAAPPRADRTRDRRLRVGFVSPDFGFHPVGFLSAPLFDYAAAHGLETVIFSTRDREHDDALTKRIESASGSWILCAGMDDDDLDARIRRENIDILIDMSGHTSGNRLMAFARKPAPVQMSWIGYVGTTGLPAMDYVIGDARQFPPGASDYYTERPLELRDGYACYAPPADAPDVTPLPATANGYVTFGCLNNPAKLTPAVLETFADVLNGCADSRLAFRFRGLDDPAVHVPIRAALERHGIQADRILFEGRAPHTAFLGTYNTIDIALDTFPYSGGLTTCEALWMGVPTITYPGATFAGRHAASHLFAAGFGDLIADSRDSYVAAARNLANDLDALAGLRAAMRSRVAASPLCDGARFAASFATAMREVWQAYCASG